MVRSWESMEREFGLTEQGNIDCTMLFNTAMRPWCGQMVTITSISDDYYRIEESTSWYWSDNMLLATLDFDDIDITDEEKLIANEMYNKLLI